MAKTGQQKRLLQHRQLSMFSRGQRVKRKKLTLASPTLLSADVKPPILIPVKQESEQHFHPCLCATNDSHGLLLRSDPFKAKPNAKNKAPRDVLCGALLTESSMVHSMAVCNAGWPHKRS